MKRNRNVKLHLISTSINQHEHHQRILLFYHENVLKMNSTFICDRPEILRPWSIAQSRLRNVRVWDKEFDLQPLPDQKIR